MTTRFPRFAIVLPRGRFEISREDVRQVFRRLNENREANERALDKLLTVSPYYMMPRLEAETEIRRYNMGTAIVMQMGFNSIEHQQLEDRMPQWHGYTTVLCTIYEELVAENGVPE